MSTRLPVSTIQNKWVDAQKVDLEDMTTEQSHSDNNDAAIVQNFFGTGVLLENPTQPILFDTDSLTVEQASLVSAGNFDGSGLTAHLQPSDTQLGNQLTIELTNSQLTGSTAAGRVSAGIPLDVTAFGRLSVKVLIIGLSFDNQLQMDKFYFHRPETQTTGKHYKRILAIFTNDFFGNNNCSRALGGRIIIKEAMPFELSRDALMVAQDVMPDLFFRDFKVSDPQKSLFNTLQDAIGSVWDVDALQIQTTGRQPVRSIEPNDVTTRIGQKFLATTDNIQKVTLLLGVEEDTSVSITEKFDWTGDIVVSIHALQTTLDCPYDVTPDLAIEFEPEDVPLMEMSFSQEELKSAGIVLTNVAQPVDFVFSNTVISRAGNIVIGNYYAIIWRRSGASDKGTLFSEVGTNRIENSRFTIFNSAWVDSVDEDLWFQVWTDSAKVATGQGYDRGDGIYFEKTIQDTSTGSQIDNNVNNLSFVNTGSNVQNNAVIAASLEESITTQDERTGNNVYSRKQSVPEFSFVTNANLETIKETQEPLIIGCMSDQNPKDKSDIIGTQEYIGLAQDDLFIIINPDADLLSRQLVGRKLIPQSICSSYEYRIFNVRLCTDGYGDVNGDGVIDEADVLRASQLIGQGLASPATQQLIVDGEIQTLEILRADVDGDGYVTSSDVEAIENFVNKQSFSFTVGSTFRHLELTVQSSIGRWDGYHDCDGYIRLDGYCFTGGQINPDDLEGTEEEQLAQRLYFGNPGIPSINGDNPAFSVVPFESVGYSIEYQDFWQDYLLGLSSESRKLPATFTYDSSPDNSQCDSTDLFGCESRVVNTVECDPGRNDFFVPNNLIIGDGTLIRANGNPVSPDVEVGTVILELPEQNFDETTIDVFRKFVVDRGDGFTVAGYPAMRYFDCTTVQIGDLDLQRVRFNVSIQSFSPNLDGYDEVDGYGIVVDDIIGVYMDSSSGLLKLTAKDLTASQMLKTRTTRIQIIVYLKKSGFNNRVLVIPSNEILGLISDTLTDTELNGYYAGIGTIPNPLPETGIGSFKLYDYQLGVNFEINDATYTFLQEAVTRSATLEVFGVSFSGDYIIESLSIVSGYPELIVSGLDVVSPSVSDLAVRNSWRIRF